MSRDPASLDELWAPVGSEPDRPHDRGLSSPEWAKHFFVQGVGVQPSRQAGSLVQNDLKPASLVLDRVQPAGNEGRLWRGDGIQQTLDPLSGGAIKSETGIRESVWDQFAANLGIARYLGHFHDGREHRGVETFPGRTAGLGFLDGIRNQVEGCRLSRKRLSPERRDSKLLRSSLREPWGFEAKTG